MSQSLYSWKCFNSFEQLSSPWHLFTLREYLERLQLLKTPEERQRILEGVPEIHADPNINPSHGSDEDEGETEDKRQENSLRPRGSGFSRRGREQIPPEKEVLLQYLGWIKEPSRNMTPKGFSNKGDDFGAGEACWEMPKTASNASQTMNSTSDPPAVDSSFPKTQLVQSPHLPSSYTGNIAQAAPAPVEVPKYPTDGGVLGQTSLPTPG
uniref:Uncharacterized protein n=1 Tax=Populus alba TaxID=43335 RepID=A0A4U5QAQ3_POPAL|nr:hypothetical protein D5086_0000135220 [Populus alba]